MLRRWQKHKALSRGARKAAVVCALLAALFTFAFLVSFRRGLSYTDHSDRFVVDLSFGCLSFYWRPVIYDNPHVPRVRGFVYSGVDGRPQLVPCVSIHPLSIELPLWMPSVLSLAMMCAVVCTGLEYTKGLCVLCGYDLRGCVSTRCPECGSLIKPEEGQNAKSK